MGRTAGARDRDSELAFDFILSARRLRSLEGLAAFLTSNLVVLAKWIPMSAVEEINTLAFDRSEVSFVTNTVTLRLSLKRECIMMNFRLIGVAALSLMLAGPAMASSGSYGTDRVYRELYRHHRMPAQDAIRFGYGNEYPTYHSGWGGLYGDGDYPGSIDENMGPPHWGG
jgi:hypothetical protein